MVVLLEAAVDGVLPLGRARLLAPLREPGLFPSPREAGLLAPMRPVAGVVAPMRPVVAAALAAAGAAVVEAGLR